MSEWNNSMLDLGAAEDWGAFSQPAVKQEEQPPKVEEEYDPDSGYFPQPTEDVESGVDGKGMWKSWTHNYEQPKFACLDLLDNCFDATLSSTSDTADFTGKVAMKYLAPNGITITNNSCNPIKDLQETLTAYRSQKNVEAGIKKEEFVKKDAIGEYGVGLKQACATLADTSFVLTKNDNQFQLGVIAKDLQTMNSVSLPHYSFEINEDAGDIQEQFHAALTQILKDNPKIYHLVTNTIGHGNRKNGVQALVQQYTQIHSFQNEPRVFQLVLTHFIHGADAHYQKREHGIKKQPALQFLDEIQDILPEHYINVPLQRFQFTIQDQPVRFSFWQHRLVEMTKFEVAIPKDKAVQSLPDSSPWAQEGYPLSIYLGFDALRLEDSKRPKTCTLHIYSRQSGRLIDTTHDARDLLGLASSGVDFCQGLTVIIDDVGGELPLKPTKDGLTWSKDTFGEIHKANLFTWTGAVAFMYWKYHAHLFEVKCHSKEWKSLIKDAVKSFVPRVQQRLQHANEIDTNDNSLERVEDAKFCMFSDVRWKKTQKKVTMKVEIRSKTHYRNMVLWRRDTPATVWKFDDSHYPKPTVNHAGLVTPVSTKKRGRPSMVSVAKKRRSSAGSPPTHMPMMGTTADLIAPTPLGLTRNYSAASAANNDSDSSSSGEEEEEVVGELASPNTARKTMGGFASPHAATRLPQMGIARKRNSGARASMVAHNNNHMLPPVPEHDHGDMQRIREVEEELRQKNLEVLRLKMDVKAAQRQVQQHPTGTGEGGAGQGLLQAKEKECAQLRHDNSQLVQRNNHLEQMGSENMLQLQQQLQQATQENAQLKAQKQQWEQQLPRVQKMQQAYLATRQENEQLKQNRVKEHKLIVDKTVQQMKQAASVEILKVNQTKLELDRALKEKEQTIGQLQADLNDREKTITQLMTTGGNLQWGGGTDQI